MKIQAFCSFTEIFVDFTSEKKEKFSVLEEIIDYMMLFKNCHSTHYFMYASIDLGSVLLCMLSGT